MSYLEKTTSGMSDGNLKIWTLSFWMKRAKLGSEQFLWSWGENNSNDGKLLFGSGDQLVFMNDGQCGSNQTMTRALRDTNGWYHIVWRCKADEGSNDNRWKLYINGELIPASEYGSPSISNADGIVNKWSTQDCWHGGNARSQQSGSINPFYGLMSHIHFCDGYAYDASDFGETDATTGEWKIKTNPSVSYGTNGYFILKNGNSGTDESPNSNNFTTVGTITKTEDNPSHVFATFNPLLSMNSSMSLANGNTKATTGNGYDAGRSNSYFSTLGMTKGKYYAEFKVVTAPSAACLIGVGYDLSSAQQGTTTNQYNLSFTNLGFSYNSVGSIGNDGDGWTSTGYDTYTADDYIGIAIDLDNNKLYVSKNGTWQNSGTGFSITADKEYFFAVSDNNGAQVYVYEANFGNGCFGSTQLTGTTYNGADGNGIFKYDPNNITLDSTTKSFKSLSTKGLNA